MKIAIITGSRGDHSALEIVHEALSVDHSVRWIDVEPGIPVRFSSDAAGVAGVTTSTVAGDLATYPTDLVMILGDRYEALGAAVGASIMGVPIAHLSGGDLTEGSQDDAYRHAITKLAHIHFPTNNNAGRRIIQMGEDLYRVFVVGWPNIDRLCRMVLMDRDATSKALSLPRGLRWVVVSVHPDTGRDVPQAWKAIHEALKGLGGDVTIVLIGPNRDPGHGEIEEAWKAMVSDRVFYFPRLDEFEFLSLLSHADVLVGNSSVGFYESPSMALPTINIGNRQKGRIPSSLLMTVEPNSEVILTLIESILSGKIKLPIPTINPYGDGHASEKIAEVLRDIGGDPRRLLAKRFRDLGDGPSKQEVGDMSKRAYGAVC